MEKKNLLNYFTENSNGVRMREKWLVKNNINLYNNIIDYCKNIDVPFNQKIYLYINDLEKIPKCEVCGGDVKFLSVRVGYNKNCSIKCGVNNKSTKQKKVDTNLKKYGVVHPLKNVKIKEKIKKTNLEKYGVTCTIHNKDVKEKVKNTNLEKYGHEHHWSSETIKNKNKESFIKNYGVENPFQSGIVKEKIKKTNLGTYGVENPSQSIEIRNKINDNRIKEKLNNFSGYTLLNYENKYLNLKCEECGEEFGIENYLFNQRNRLGYCICTKCFPLNGSNYTKPHREIVTHIESVGDFNLELNTKKVLGGKELDIYLPEKKIAIEFNGLYWHSELNKPKNYHILKSEKCNQLGIKLLHIFEDEWLQNPDIVKSIINSNLGVYNKTIYARKCVVRELTPKECKPFLVINHLQGHVNAKVKLGLFYESKLVSVMTFGSRSGVGNRDYEYEMLRFCNKLNTKIVGGASKLLKYFIKNYKPKSIVSYSDNRWFDGGLYKKLGFNFVNNTSINYWYFKGFVRYHRYGFRKDKLVRDGFDQNKTESEIMLERGYGKIWDCGNKKWVWLGE
jgi:hypothetical protein